MWGVLADRYGRKLMVMRSMLGGVLVLGLMAYVQNVYQLLGLRILQGILTGTVTASVALVASVVPIRRAGFAMGLMQQALFIGNAVGPLIGGVSADHFGYRIPFLFAAGFLVLGAALTWFGVHEDFDADEMDAEGDGVMTLRDVLTITGFSTLIGLLFMVHFSGAFIGPILPLYLERLGSHSNTTTGFVFALGAVSAAIAAPVIGLLGDRIGYATILRSCTFLNGVLLIPQGLARTVTQLAALRMAFSFSDVGTMPTANALIRRIVPRHACGKAFSLVQSVTCFGWGLGPICGSALAARYGMRVPFFIVGGVFLVISVIVAKVLPKMMAQIEAGEAQAAGCDMAELVAETGEYERLASQGLSQD
ncbi:MAG: MFS transporter, partial [Armatimonadota bacterium]